MATHGGDLRSAVEKYGNLDFCDFSANINPLGPPAGVFRAIEQNLGAIIHYPDPHGRQLKQILSSKLGVDCEQIILGNGAVELVYLLAHALHPQTALIPVPTFSEYARALHAVGSEVRYKYLLPEQGFALELTAADFASDILFLCNPNNPTGRFLSFSEFTKILDLAKRHDAFVVVDESFMDFVSPSEQWRAYHCLREYDRMFVLYSLTKFYAIPGLRLGVGIGTPGLIEQLGALKDPWNINNLALAAGEAALEDTEFAVRSRQVVAEERKFLADRLSQLPFVTKVYDAAANFLLFETALGYGMRLVDELARAGVLIRSCSNFPGLDDKFFRVAVKDRPSNLKLLQSLQKCTTAEF